MERLINQCRKKFLLIIKLLVLSVGFSIAEIQADIVVVVHPDNPITSLTKKDVKRLFLGRMHNFPNSDIKVESIDHAEGSADYDKFYSSIINMNKSKLKRYRAYYLFSGKGRLPTQIKTASKVLKYIANTKNAIAYIDKKNITDSVKVVYVD
jgi:ABC-type phosphate transport system substrate-binding protein